MQLECISNSRFINEKLGRIILNNEKIYIELVQRYLIFPFSQILVKEKYAYGVSLK